MRLNTVDSMKRSIIITIGAVATVGALTVGTAVIATQGGDDSEAPITGDALQKATDAALEHLGGGRVTDTEVGDEDSLYEVEVTRSDGSQVDVQLDANFAVVDDTPDIENEPDDD